jgi:Transferase family
MLDSVRATAAPPTSDLPSVTDAAAITALVWMSISQARELSLKHVASSAMYILVNVRQLLDPPILSESPGIILVVARPSAPTSQLESSDPRALHSVALRITETISHWIPDEICALAASIEDSTDVVNKVLPPLDYDLAISAPTRMGDQLVNG